VSVVIVVVVIVVVDLAVGWEWGESVAETTCDGSGVVSVAIVDRWIVFLISRDALLNSYNKCWFGLQA
jgi:hypothetical protein